MSRHGQYRKLRFCPRCGVEGLERDNYNVSENFPHAEYLCRICGFGFRIGTSKRVALAETMFAETRRQRVGKFYQDVPEELQKGYTDFYPH
jgi:rubredoxin